MEEIFDMHNIFCVMCEREKKNFKLNFYIIFLYRSINFFSRLHTNFFSLILINKIGRLKRFEIITFNLSPFLTFLSFIFSKNRIEGFMTKIYSEDFSLINKEFFCSWIG